jgi:hypothetical protein
MLDPSNQQLCTLAAAAGVALGWRSGTGSPYDEWELWHEDLSPMTQKQLEILTQFVQSRPEGIALQMPPPRSDAKPLSELLRRTMQGLSTVGPAPLTIGTSRKAQPNTAGVSSRMTLLRCLCTFRPWALCTPMALSEATQNPHDSVGAIITLRSVGCKGWMLVATTSAQLLICTWAGPFYMRSVGRS